ncbi:hypothetical protein WA026_004012 [Henosepilachna vigintioctopunctata]|uniref:Uncharacterized protein n=1 Tax=Henosepilachna vigintioctopunctata TaxID=420089 RepID=A0AAW1U9B7_9CUCU
MKIPVQLSPVNKTATSPDRTEETVSNSQVIWSKNLVKYYRGFREWDLLEIYARGWLRERAAAAIFNVGGSERRWLLVAVDFNLHARGFYPCPRALLRSHPPGTPSKDYDDKNIL